MKDRSLMRWLWLIGLAALLGCKAAEKSIAPSNFRDWSPDQAVLPTADINGNYASLHNIRYCKYLGPDEYVVDYYDKAFDLSKLQGVDFISMPFSGAPALAHTMLSFEFAPDQTDDPNAEPQHLAVSVEVRKEKGEEIFNPFLGSARQYEIMYVVADERDIIARQTNVRQQPVYIYRTKASPEDARDLLVDMLQRANKLSEKPEFYDLLTNNCTTNIARHINQIRPGRIVYDIGVLLPGYSDRKAYMEGLLAGTGSFAEIKANADVTARARLAAGADDFSRRIRR